MLTGEIDDDAMEKCASWILGMNIHAPDTEVLQLYICSLGGDLHSAFALIEIMKRSKIPIQTIAIGQICSAGLFIFISGTKGLRTLTESVSIMSHNFSTEVSGSYPSMMHVQKELTYAHNRILKLYKEQSNLSEKYIVEHLIGPYDYYLEPKEALELGLADSIE